VLIFFLACQNKSSLELEGLWELHIMETKDSVSNVWNNYKGGMQGFLLYDGVENMSLYLSTKDYENTDLEFANFNDTLALEKLKYLTGSYFYIGKYKIDTENNIVTHKRLAHSNPNDWNKTVERRFQFKGDTLIITPVEAKNASLRLKWLKAKE
jgi:hypothetical protein